MRQKKLILMIVTLGVLASGCLGDTSFKAVKLQGAVDVNQEFDDTQDAQKEMSSLIDEELQNMGSDNETQGLSLEDARKKLEEGSEEASEEMSSLIGQELQNMETPQQKLERTSENATTQMSDLIGQELQNME